jgi:hypothetical protein
MLMERSGEERLKMGCSMHATALALAKAYIARQHPGSHPAELKRLVFLHFYANDFAPEERKRIALALARKGRADGERRNPLINSTIVESSDAVRESEGRYRKKGKKKGKRSRQERR